MASYNNPQAGNPILGDLRSIKHSLISAAKMDPATGNTDIPSGAKRLVSVSGGHQLQSFNGSKWAPSASSCTTPIRWTASTPILER